MKAARRNTAIGCGIGPQMGFMRSRADHGARIQLVLELQEPLDPLFSISERMPDPPEPRKHHCGWFRLASSNHLDCMAGMAEAPFATVALSGFGGEIKMGSSIDTAMIPAMMCRPLAYDPLLCRKCAMSKGPNALAKPHAVSMSP